jgi:methylated-DNA-[protein]-cysteine S-methyltransferase
MEPKNLGPRSTCKLLKIKIGQFSIFFSVLQTGTPVGDVTLVASERGLRVLSFHGKPPNNAVERESELRPYTKQLQEYLACTRKQFDVPLDLVGTDFQLACWNALLEIPYGETRSYAEQARRIGRPAAFRAVGQANHTNPVAIIVPCHRVIGANVSLTGYGGGMPAKQWLLELEGVQSKRLAVTAAE